ncbi:MAG: hypothetical protein CFH01_00726 [Alphaproteobacteria bacterium MarineAlpha2_Bin1]|nr:MAG: hypothetical protein CFH01_00726 [Alphaproteobacteria bacterium MarineAlpha2_Bin1]
MKYLIIFFILSIIVIFTILFSIKPDIVDTIYNIISEKKDKIIIIDEIKKESHLEKNISKELLPDPPKQKPKFDIVRVTREGSSVIAGTAPKKSIIKIYEGQKLIGETKTNENGEWVLIPRKNFKEGSIELTIESILEDGTKVSSDEIVIISVPKKDKKESKPLAILSEKNTLSPSKILQNDNSLVLDNQRNIVIDIIDYDDKGNIIISGRSLPNSEIKIYLDNEIVSNTISDESGLWVSIITKKINPGNYELKSELNKNGNAIGLAITPFTRIDHNDLNFSNDNMIVQPGNSLWRIARRVYGSGFRYTIIFEANKNKIKDPDLIYPGQIFKLPKN